MNLVDLINRIERKRKWRESSGEEVELGCTVILAILLLAVVLYFLLK